MGDCWSINRKLAGVMGCGEKQKGGPRQLKISLVQGSGTSKHFEVLLMGTCPSPLFSQWSKHSPFSIHVPDSPGTNAVVSLTIPPRTTSAQGQHTPVLGPASTRGPLSSHHHPRTPPFPPNSWRPFVCRPCHLPRHSRLCYSHLQQRVSRSGMR